MSVLHRGMDMGHAGVMEMRGHMGTHGHGTRTWAWTQRCAEIQTQHTQGHTDTGHLGTDAVALCT